MASPGGPALPRRLTAKQQGLKEEMANESGRGGEWDMQGCRLRGDGQIAAGVFNTYRNCVKLVVVSTACTVTKRIGYDAAVSVHVAVKLGEAP